MIRKRVKDKIFVISITLFILLISLVIIMTFGSSYVVAENSNGNDDLLLEINNADEFKQFAVDVNNGIKDGFYGYTFTLNSNIELTEELWIPVGTNEYPFKGTFNGNGYEISGLNINNQEKNQTGLFGNIFSSATIKNVAVKGNVFGTNYTAGIVGYNAGKVENCFNYSEIQAIDGSVNIGGVVGYNIGEVIGCGNYGTINENFLSVVGGVIGNNAGKCVNCFNIGKVSSIDAVVGGVVGQNNEKAIVAESFNSGNIIGKTDIGGIAGINFGKISDVYNTGSVYGNVNNVGGIIGTNEASAELKSAYSATAQIYGHSTFAAIVGLNKGIVYRVYYDKNIFDGDIVNGYAASESFGLRTELMLHSNSLADNEKLGGLLLSENSNVWIKNESDETYGYYPELKFFSENNNIVSKQSTKVFRTKLSAEDVELTETTFVYDNTAKTPKIKLKDLLLEEGEDYIISYKDNINAGKAEVLVNFLNNFSGEIKKNFNIEKKEIGYEWIVEEYIYNGKFQAPTITIISGIVDGQDVTFEYIYVNSINFGTYQANVKLADTEINKNYFIQKNIQTYNIKKKLIDIEWSSDKLYYNGLPQAPTIVNINGILNNDSIVLKYDYSDNINVNNYELNFELQDNDINNNYYFEISALNYQIYKQTIEIVWNEYDFVYNAEIQHPTAKVVSGQIGNEIIQLQYIGFEGNINANEYNEYFVQAILADNAINRNYFLDYSVLYYSIKKRPITIDWWDTPLVYSGQAQHPVCYVQSGVLGDDIITFEYLDYNNNINAGRGYVAIVKLADNSVNDNYFFETQNKEYSIEKAKFNVDNVVFKDAVFAYDGNNKSIFIQSELPIGVNVEYENNSAVEIGEYKVKANFTVNENNYLPLKKTFLEAVIFIAQSTFNTDDNKINLTILDNFSYSMRVDIKGVKKSKAFKVSNKRVLNAYSVNILDFNGKVKISIILTEKDNKNTGLAIAYKNANGDIIFPEYNLEDGMIVFVADNISSFVVIADNNYTLLFIIIGSVLGICIIVSTIILILYFKKKHKIINNVINNTEELELGQEIVSDNLDCQDEKSNINVQEVNDFNHSILENTFSCDNTNERLENLYTNNFSTNKNNCDYFIIDGVKCRSFECFIASLKFRNINKQKLICAGNKEVAKLIEIIPKNKVFWLGEAYVVGSKKYNELLERVRRNANEENG